MGSDNSRSKLLPILAETMNFSVSSSKELIKRLCRETAIDMKCDKLSFAEQRRVCWTTYANLELWFDSWEKTLTDGSRGEGEIGVVDEGCRREWLECV